MTTIREQLGGDTLSKKRPLITGLTAATRLLTVEESGSLVFLDKVDGITITLPYAVDVGTFYDFLCVATVTSNAYKVLTYTVASELIVGKIVSCDTDTTNTTLAFPALVGSSYVSVNLNGSTTGGLKGDQFRLTKINATTWLCEGNINCTGDPATPFATS